MSAQDSELYYKGRFLNKKEKPQNLLKVTNKSSGKYEFTDEEGYAIIQAKANDTLTWNNGKSVMIVNYYYLSELKSLLNREIPKKPVKEIISEDYKALNDSDTLAKNTSEYDLQLSPYFLNQRSDDSFYHLKKVKVKSNATVLLTRVKNLKLGISGNFSSSVDVYSQNGLPKVQNQFVQGYSENGNLVWTSPDRSNFFSYGPDISTLGFDGVPNPYDQNGNLVAIQNSQSVAKIYDNNIIKPLIKFSNFLSLNSVYKEDNQETLGFKIKLGQIKDPLYFSDQFYRENQLGSTVNFNVWETKFNLQYQYNKVKATNSNRVGLFNRVYENSLLTPISFNNNQNTYLENGNQRSFNSNFDNPNFLLDNQDKFNFKSSTNRWNLNVEKELFYDFKIYANGSAENNHYWHHDSFANSTAFFSNGIENFRKQRNQNNIGEIGASYKTEGGDFNHYFSGIYIVNDVSTKINHSLTSQNYQYQRTSNEFIFNYKPEIDLYDVKINFDFSNSFYSSNSKTDSQLWLPKAFGSIKIQEIFGTYNSELSIFGGYSRSTEEADIQKSYAFYGLSQLQPENSFSYFPVSEMSSYANLLNIDKSEWKAGFTLKPNYRLLFSVEYFNKKVKNDAFPYLENGILSMKNMADHTMEGIEGKFETSKLYLDSNFFISNRLYFYAYRDIVNKVVEGYNYQPIVGFSSVYNGLVEGKALGSIVGTSYLRNANGDLIIGDDGFPIKDSSLKVIANPTPDFSLKLSNTLEFRNWRLDLDWEWQKGGKIWNGTQAALDYYGRSQNSAELRNTWNYVFDGVNTSGDVNTVTVDFYNPELSVLENRWTRYGVSGVTEAYIQDADYVKLNNIALSFVCKIRDYRDLKLTGSVSNILLWRKNDGIDPSQNFYNTDGGKGLDYFNLPNYMHYKLGVSFDF